MSDDNEYRLGLLPYDRSKCSGERRLLESMRADINQSLDREPRKELLDTLPSWKEVLYDGEDNK